MNGPVAASIARCVDLAHGTRYAAFYLAVTCSSATTPPLFVINRGRINGRCKRFKAGVRRLQRKRC